MKIGRPLEIISSGRRIKFYVSFEIEIDGNLEEKSFAFCAIATATWRATDL